MDKCYFDYAATTPVADNILEVYTKVTKQYFMNNSNDEKSKELLKNCNRKILDLLNIDNTYEVIFTSGGTEANNLAIMGRYAKSDKKHFITSMIEHPSILETFRELESLGHEVKYIKPNDEGLILVQDVISSIKKNTALISIMSVNNEIGKIIDVDEIFKQVKKVNENIITMTDCVQGLGKINIDMKHIDMITFSAHKAYGLKGVGALVKKKNIKLDQQIFGSKSLVRPGTFSLALKVSFVNSFKKAIEEQPQNIKEIQNRQIYFLNKIDRKKIHLNAHPDVGIISMNLDIDALGQTVSKYLFDKGIVVSTKSACSQKLNTRSHVLLALNKSNDEIDKTIRVSFSKNTTYDEIDKLIKELEEVLKIFK